MSPSPSCTLSSKFVELRVCYHDCAPFWEHQPEERKSKEQRKKQQTYANHQRARSASSHYHTLKRLQKAVCHHSGNIQAGIEGRELRAVGTSRIPCVHILTAMLPRANDGTSGEYAITDDIMCWLYQWYWLTWGRLVDWFAQYCHQQ